MVGIDHFTKFLELEALPTKETVRTSSQLRKILGRYGCPGEVLTDRGGEWEAEFDSVCQQAFIDHRRTSAEQPQTNGLAERVVQTVKNSLRRMCSARNTTAQWDEMLPWIMLGYNCSKQKSIGFSPYHLMFGVDPVLPSPVKAEMSVEIDYDDPTAAAAHVMQRSALMKRNAAMAGDNLAIAQQRDSLRYAMHRSGQYLPKLADFHVGDFVYVRQTQHVTLQPEARKLILRVKEIRPTGVLILEGRCG
jgi:hypothetical protein